MQHEFLPSGILPSTCISEGLRCISPGCRHSYRALVARTMGSV